MSDGVGRAALYARMEGADLSARTGLEVQLNVCEYAAKQRGLRVTDRLTDLAASGHTLLRPGMQRLLASVCDRRIDAVVVTGLPQLTYRADDWRFLDELFRESDVRLFTVVPQRIALHPVGSA